MEREGSWGEGLGMKGPGKIGFLGDRGIGSSLELARATQGRIRPRETELEHIRVWMLWPTASESSAWMYS